MLTTEQKEEIRQIVSEMLLATPASKKQRERADEADFVSGAFLAERRIGSIEAKPIIEIAARAMEVFGTREKALRWLNSPVGSLGGQTPLSLLNTPEGITQVQDILGRVEHGVW